MYKAKLKDGTIIEIENNGFENEICTIMSDLTTLNTLVPKMTDKNLSLVQKFNDNDAMYCKLNNMKLDSVIIKPIASNYKVTFIMAEISREDLLEKRIEELEKSQNIQNEAISDMSASMYA